MLVRELERSPDWRVVALVDDERMDAPAGGAAPRVSAEVSDFVYYPSYTRLAVGDSVTVLVLPEAPTGPVLLREVTVDRAMVPLTQSPWAVVVLGLLSAGCVLVYRRFG